MDLNRLYFRHQLLLMRANCAADEAIGLKYEAKAAGVARSIMAFQEYLGAWAARSWRAECGQ
ncbi:hypothetical protein FHW96_000181 [Novosphingobium sp. SG751A]|uniref:hypothetical protein n=1 Tax=Novosphingobium sp. SG751A TaxID=2587000 RepID=UPI001554ABFC|nr:hypothetical protein [Novosphingobium sp. SG751A]NOW44054.1 hypothetical protein [Novosphingobium sp. SG751A]